MIPQYAALQVIGNGTGTSVFDDMFAGFIIAVIIVALFLGYAWYLKHKK